MSIIIAADHAGFALKSRVIAHFELIGVPYRDVGTDSDEPVDYPDFAQDVVSLMNASNLGVLICGTGNGMAMTANRHRNIRCALALTPEMARLARAHNNANVLALGARLVNHDLAIAIVDSFLATEFDGGRHLARIEKIDVMIGFNASYIPHPKDQEFGQPTQAD
jgi:ribose 5-phosphate isomerase B